MTIPKPDPRLKLIFDKECEKASSLFLQDGELAFRAIFIRPDYSIVMAFVPSIPDREAKSILYGKLQAMATACDAIAWVSLAESWITVNPDITPHDDPDRKEGIAGFLIFREDDKVWQTAMVRMITRQDDMVALDPAEVSDVRLIGDGNLNDILSATRPSSSERKRAKEVMAVFNATMH